MAGSRDPLRDLPEAPPMRDLAVAPTRVGSGRPVRGAAAVLALIAGVIAAGLGLAQLPSFAPLPAASPAASDAPATAAPTAAPALAVVDAVPPRLARDELRDRVLDGSLDGRLVFVDGVLDVTPVRCQSLAQASGGCVDLAIGGLGLPVWAGAVAIPWRGDPVPGSWLVTVARAGGLVYLGSLVPDPAAPGTVADLANRLRGGAAVAPVGTLFEVPGWLVTGPPGEGTPASPFLAADEPSMDGTLGSARGSVVALESPVVGVDRDASVTPGTFLLAPPEGCRPARARGTCRLGGTWLVVARYEPARAVRVLVP